jgi:hypothetical protein
MRFYRLKKLCIFVAVVLTFGGIMHVDREKLKKALRSKRAWIHNRKCFHK